MISDISDTDHSKYDSGLKMLLQLWNINQSKLHTFYYPAIEEMTEILFGTSEEG